LFRWRAAVADFFSPRSAKPWRAEAEVACLKSGAVKENADLVRISPISGPGICGAEFPLKVAAFGEDSSSFGFADDDLRPPATIGNQPRWPITQAPQQPPPYPDHAMRQPGYGTGSSGPISLTAPASPATRVKSNCRPTARPESAEQGVAGALWRAALSVARPLFSPPSENAGSAYPPQAAPLPRLGPGQGNPVAAFGPVAVKPVATLACPIVSVLDRWLADSVQPAAMRWFGQRVVEISRSRPIPAAA